MGRWKPPQPASSPYITAKGYENLQNELKTLWSRRTDVVAALSAAAAEGDRSENAEYIYRKKELAGIDRRIRYLQKRLPQLKVVSATPDSDQIFFGARVRLDRDGKELWLRIVGGDEIGEPNTISIDSPLARALLKRRVGDEISVHVPEGVQVYQVLELAYG